MISKILFWNLFTSKGIYMIDWVGPNRTYAWWVMSYIWMSRTTHMSESCHTYGWVMSHIWMSHATHMNESCPTHNWWIMVDMSMSHATHMNDSWHTYEWVVSCRWMRHATYMNESCPTYEWVMSHIRMSHVPHTNDESWRRGGWVMSHIRMSRVYITRTCPSISFSNLNLIGLFSTGRGKRDVGN